MSKDQGIGGILLIASILGILIYFWLMFLAGDLWVIFAKLTLFVAVALVLGIVAWIGYTLATTPPPKPIEEIEEELEKEKKEEVPPPPSTSAKGAEGEKPKE